MKVVIPLSLDDERDADIIQWLNQRENKSSAIREAIRAYLANDLTLADIYREIQALKSCSCSFVPAQNQPISGVDEALDKLLGLGE